MKFIFEIKIKKGHTEKEYLDAWKRGSAIIQQSKGAQGTVLFRKIGEARTLIAIAEWESKKTRDVAMKKLEKVEPKIRAILDKHKDYGDINKLGNFEEIARVEPKVKRSVQAIEDYYYQKGLRGDMLRRVVEQDEDYKRILEEKRSRLTKRFQVKAVDRKRYVLATDGDYEILTKTYELDRKSLPKIDREVLKLIRSQLLNDWRAPLLKFLNQLLRKYR